MRAEYDFSKGKRGAVIRGKTRITIFIDNAILEAFRARAQKAGMGYQTMINEALRAYLTQAEQPLTEQVLRHVLREEMPEYLRDLKARRFVGSDKAKGDVARRSKRMPPASRK